MTMKASQGNLLVNLAEEGRLYLPHSRYVADDFMRVAKKAGSFDAIVGTNGEHGDTFDCTKHVIHGLIGSGPAKADAVEMGGLGSPPPSDRDAGRFSSENRETFTLNS